MNMMWKKGIALLLCLLMGLSLMACAKDTKDGNGNNESDDGEQTKASAYAVICNGTKLALGASADGVIETLGEPSMTKEVFDCGEGNSRMYYRFASIELYVMKSSDGKETIDQIELNDDLVQTDKGIGIGSTAADVEAAYGTPTGKDNGKWVYTSGDQNLLIDIEDGKVSDIGLLRVTK